MSPVFEESDLEASNLGFQMNDCFKKEKCPVDQPGGESVQDRGVGGRDKGSTLSLYRRIMMGR